MHARFLLSAFQPRQYPPPDKPEIAFAGRSNVGKSSLINTLVNRRGLARTSSTPGRTQAINFFDVDDRLYFVDLPGYGFARVPMAVKKSWRHMVESYLQGRPNLCAVVLILDIRRDPNAGDLDLFHWLTLNHITPVAVLTKADKLSRQQVLKRRNLIAHRVKDHCAGGMVVFSSKTRQGKEEIWSKIDALIGRTEASGE